VLRGAEGCSEGLAVGNWDATGMRVLERAVK